MTFKNNFYKVYNIDYDVAEAWRLLRCTIAGCFQNSVVQSKHEQMPKSYFLIPEYKKKVLLGDFVGSVILKAKVKKTSKHTTSFWRCYNVVLTLIQSCFNVDFTLFWRWYNVVLTLIQRCLLQRCNGVVCLLGEGLTAAVFFRKISFSDEFLHLTHFKSKLIRLR